MDQQVIVDKKNDLTPLQDLSILFNFTSLSHFSAKSKLNVTQPRHPAKNKETIQRKKKYTLIDKFFIRSEIYSEKSVYDFFPLKMWRNVYLCQVFQLPRHFHYHDFK